jgi:hypothetical protein
VGVFFRNLGDNVENSANDGGLAYKISEGRLKTLIRDVAILILKILWLWLAGAEESAVINKIPEILKQILCRTGTQQNSVTIDGNTNIFHDQNKFKQYLYTNPAHQRIINGKLQPKEGNYSLEKARKYSPFNKTKQNNNNKKTHIISSLTTKITESNILFSLMSFNINGLNSPIKRHRLSDWLHQKNPTFCYIQ